MATYIILTRDGVADQGQEKLLANLAEDLKKPNAKLLLHLHGGLNNKKSADETAKRLSGNEPDSWRLGNDWTQVYVVWRTGFLETIQTNWTELVQDDRFYQTITRKLLAFVARKLGVPMPTGRGTETTAITEAEIHRRLTGHAGPHPFDALDAILSSDRPAGERATVFGEQSSGSLADEFRRELRGDKDFLRAAGDIDEAVNVTSGARASSVGADQPAGEKMLGRLNESIVRELEPPPVAQGEPRGIVSVISLLLPHAAKVALRCFKRFQSGRDHGFHATVVEEVCREFYGDLIGAKVWGMMVKDAADHFSAGGFGSALVEMLKASKPDNFVITAHSAGSIWASHLLQHMKTEKLPGGVKLFLLAPAVRKDAFATMLDSAGDLISFCRMITMKDEYERKDAVLGQDKSYIYPSSLLYLVSGLFEEQSSQPYTDAPLLGMQRFATMSGLTDAETQIETRIAAFFKQDNYKIISSPTENVSMALSHGAFDDEPWTLATASSLF